MIDRFDQTTKRKKINDRSNLLSSCSCNHTVHFHNEITKIPWKMHVLCGSVNSKSWNFTTLCRFLNFYPRFERKCHSQHWHISSSYISFFYAPIDHNSLIPKLFNISIYNMHAYTVYNYTCTYSLSCWICLVYSFPKEDTKETRFLLSMITVLKIQTKWVIDELFTVNIL